MNRLRFRDSEDVRVVAGAAMEAIAAGGVILMPTESFYGLGGDPDDDGAVARICAMKERSPGMGLPIICADWQQVERLARIPERYRVKLSRTWPAAMTIVAAARRELAAGRAGTVAVRIPGLAPLRALLYRVGPLTATSANRHRQPACDTPEDALQSIQGLPDLVLDGGRTAGGAPSTLVDLTGASPRVLRSGACSWDDTLPEP
jgi:L-threonylcarbamoyladenylate synthase